METPIEKAIRELKASEEDLDFIKAAFEVERAKRRELEVQVDNLIDENYFLRWKLGPQAPTFSPCKRCIRLFVESHITPHCDTCSWGSPLRKCRP